ncbi:uncharacterized protein [Amphiura filiformis]|uniref:uncharacterized protein n=1 Tax=Amphiura filiformis TaxID=82378 RepID=UPI003B21778E
MASPTNTLLSLAGVTVLICLKASLRIVASSSCEEGLFSFGFAGVNKMSIHIRFNTRMVNEGNWTLEAHVNWSRPAMFGPPSDFKGYALQMFPTEQPGTADTDFCTSYVTSVNSSYVFTNLIWGKEYLFMIAVANWNKTFTRLSSIQIKKSQLAPDCYEETGDRQFCNQIGEKFSKVSDVRVDCIVRDDVDPTILTVYISWVPPVQVNGDLLAVEIKYWEFSKPTMKYHKLENNLHQQYDITENELGGGPSFRYVSGISTLKEEKYYTMEVRMYMNNGTVYNQPVQFHFNTSNLTTDFVPYIEANTTVDGCYAIPPTMSTISPNTTLIPALIHDVYLISDDGTIVLLILLSILAVLTIVALILCYLRKRPISHLPKQGFFGTASGLTKTSAAETEALRQKGTPLFDGECDASRGDVWQTVQSSLGVNIFYEPHTPPSLSENDPIFITKEFNRSFLRIEDKLGSGQFGVVYQGFALGIDGTDKYQPVAVKSLKADATDAMKVDFLSEIKLIIEIGSHPNILPILGCCTTEEPFYLITEYMKYGDLLRFLLRCREEIYQDQDIIYKVTKRGQLQIARQIARGMEYLSSTRYYHGDLAARNVLVGEDLVVKISDFGMADDIYQQGYKRLGPERKRPVKWVSLETNTRGQCTIQSDIWSFGIVLYEIYTFGDVPYPGLDGRDVVRTLMEGFRMDKPENCSNEIYEIMLQCWHENPYDRPSFTELYTRLDDMLSQTSDDYICDLEMNVRYHPDTSQTFRASSSPIPIVTLPQGGYGFNRCPEFEIDECTC